MFEPAVALAHDAPDAAEAALTRRVKRAERLFAAGEACRSLYAVRRGFFKTRMVDAAGREQVLGFFMKGDVIGLEGLATERHTVEAVALEDSEVRILPLGLEPANEAPLWQRGLGAELARAVARQQGMMMILGSMSAAERLAAFLLDLSARLERLGYSPKEFHLRMTRAEIGSLLGLKIETVSRLFSEFEKDGLIEVDGKHVRIADNARLQGAMRPAT